LELDPFVVAVDVVDVDPAVVPVEADAAHAGVFAVFAVLRQLIALLGPRVDPEPIGVEDDFGGAFRVGLAVAVGPAVVAVGALLVVVAGPGDAPAGVGAAPVRIDLAAEVGGAGAPEDLALLLEVGLEGGGPEPFALGAAVEGV